MRKISIKNISIIFIIIILIQFLILVIRNDSDDYEIERACQEIKYELHNSNKSIIEKAKLIAIQENLNILRANKIRNFVYNLDDYEKNRLIQKISDSINYYYQHNPYKIPELKNQIEDIEKGYGIISFTMERILNLNSLEFLKNQKNYFFIILTITIYLIFLFVIILKKNKLN